MEDKSMKPPDWLLREQPNLYGEAAMSYRQSIIETHADNPRLRDRILSDAGLLHIH